MIKSGTIHSPQVGESWQYHEAEPWTITEVRADGEVWGQRPGMTAKSLTIGNIVTDGDWKRVQAATPEPGHRADPAPDERTGMLALRCKSCHGTEWRPARDGEQSPRTKKRALFVCVTCAQSGRPISPVTNDLYEESPLLAPITLKELDALEVPTTVMGSMLDLCGCGHPRWAHESAEGGSGACESCSCELFHAFCECGHAQSQHSDGGHGPGNGVCCAFPPELTGTDQCPCTNFRPKRST